MAKLWLDCEFDGYRGALLSFALVGERSDFYAIIDYAPGTNFHPWVKENVLPHMNANRQRYDVLSSIALGSVTRVQQSLEIYLRSVIEQEGGDLHIIADWPDDIKYLSELMLTGPGSMINIPGVTFEVKRIDAYPTSIPDAVQHNAWWDAYALMVKDTGEAPKPLWEDR